MAANVVQGYRTKMIDQALAVVDQNRDLPPEQQFAWTIPGWPMHRILDWPEQSPERRQRVLQAFKDGRFVVHALPFTMHTETLELEDLVRGFGFSTQVSADAGLPLPRDAKMTDVPEHTWTTATILSHAGVKFMHIGCNPMSGSPQVPPLFWWQGPDGSRVLTMYSPHYGTGLFPPDDWPHRTWLALQHTYDNLGPPKPEEVRKILQQYADKMPGVKVHIGRLSDFGEAILAEKPDLPVVRADSPDTWIHGPMSDPAGMKLARNIRPQIAAAEFLNTELRAWNQPVAAAAPGIAAAYEKSLLYGEHTWGGSIGWLDARFGFGDAFWQERAKGRYQRIEASWDEHTASIEQARDITAPLLESNLPALAQAVAVDGPRVVVFNPLPWQRDGVVRYGNHEFIARGIPAMGYRTFKTGELPAAEGKLTADSGAAMIESNAFAAVLDPQRGVVRSLIDKRSGRELVDTRSDFGLGQYLYERFDHDQIWRYIRTYLKEQDNTRAFEKRGLPENVPYEAASPRDFKLRFEETPVSVAAVMDSPATAKLPAVTTRLVLYRGQSYADLEITIHDKPFDSWPEAGWLCLPFNAEPPRFRLGRLGSIIDPAKDIVPNSNRDLFVLNTGLTLTDPQGRGVGLCPLDHPVVSLGRPGCWQFSKDDFPRKPVVFLNLFNNQWNTNFRLWNSGTWTSRVRIWAINNASDEAALITPSLESRYPLLAAGAQHTSASHPLPPTNEGLSVSRRGVLVTAFGDISRTGKTQLRLWELAGESGSLSVGLPKGFPATRAIPVNLRGEPAGETIPVIDNTFRCALSAFSPASFILATNENEPVRQSSKPTTAGQTGDAAAKPDATTGFTWPSAIPADCPFPRSTNLTGVHFTGRSRAYRAGDTWYPSWADDGNLYSPWTDGGLEGMVSGSSHGENAKTGHAVMIGDDPLNLGIHNTSPPKAASALPYQGRYPCGSLVYNGVWYYGTYCLGPEGAHKHNGLEWNWPNLGPTPGFHISRDLGKTWQAPPHSPEQPLFPEPARFLGPVKMGAPHFVDFGKNMEHSPDGMAYLLGMGAEETDPQPRPCLKLGKPGEGFEINPACADDFAHANLSWISADQVYLARVKPSPETINKLGAYEFFAGHDATGRPVWTADFAKIKPLLDWNNHMGCVTATYVPGLKKYLMCVTDGWPTMSKMTSYILEADVLTGPWRIVTYMKDFGEQGFFLNFPGKFISADGRTLWLCYSANFSSGMNGLQLKLNPPGGRGVLRLHEVKLLGPGESKSLMNAEKAATP
jgi:hypothetical protein